MRPSPRRPAPPRDAGLSLAEYLVIVVLIGILAAAVLPLYLDEPASAKAIAAESDILSLGPLVRAASEASDGFVDVTSDGENYIVDGEAVLEVSPGVELTRYSGDSRDNWCLELRHPQGTRSPDSSLHYDARDGFLEPQETC
jgi:type II secretory pathway pseudopilin PulG